MLKSKKIFGFTLSELIMAMGIIGIVAAMAVPSVVENLHKKTFVAQLKSVVGEIQQLAQNQMAVKGTKDLSLTDFSSSEKLFNDINFMIVKKCSESDAEEKCWNNTKYKFLNKEGEYAISNKDTIILKNGVILSYSLAGNLDITGANEKAYGFFVVDVNGLDKPNIVGRDLFTFYISEKGNIVPTLNPGTSTVSGCTTNGVPDNCTDLIITNGWRMTY